MKLLPAELKYFLDEKEKLYNNKGFIENDPISIPHLFKKKEDIELAAFFSATLAWGQRNIIIRNAMRLMDMMDRQPHNFILHHSPADLKAFKAFKHRTFQYADLIYFMRSLQNIYRNNGGLEPAFYTQRKNSKDSLTGFRELFFKEQKPGRTSKHIANVEKNASAKRLNMFLRWMVRCDNRGVDFGLWKSLSPEILCCPLDVHSGRIARKLGLLKRRQDDWKAVEELTGALRKLNPEDPVKYDFALFGLGVYEKF